MRSPDQEPFRLLLRIKKKRKKGHKRPGRIDRDTQEKNEVHE